MIGFVALGLRASVEALSSLKFNVAKQSKLMKKVLFDFSSVERRKQSKLLFFLLGHQCWLRNHQLWSGADLWRTCVVQFTISTSMKPLSAGSGIPEVKGFLNGVRVVGTINLKTFIGKVISIIFSYSSSLALGPGSMILNCIVTSMTEGPMVHIGALLGAGLSAAKSRTLKIR